MDKLKKARSKESVKSPPCPLPHENGKHYAGGSAGWVTCDRLK